MRNGGELTPQVFLVSLSGTFHFLPLRRFWEFDWNGSFWEDIQGFLWPLSSPWPLFFPSFLLFSPNSEKKSNFFSRLLNWIRKRQFCGNLLPLKGPDSPLDCQSHHNQVQGHRSYYFFKILHPCLLYCSIFPHNFSENSEKITEY